MNNNKKTLWVVTEVFYPDETSTAYILTEIANKLSANYNVKVICGPKYYDKKDNEAETSLSLNSDIEIQRINSVYGDKNSIFKRILRLFLLSLQMFILLCRKVSKGDKVLIVTNPAPLLLLISLIKKYKKIELIILVHDVFPENAIPAGIFKKKNLLYTFLKCLFDKAYSRSDKLIVLGRDMKEIVLSKISKFKVNNKIFIIDNWSDIENIIPSERKYEGHNNIVFQYAGNMGRVQGLMTLLNIINEIKNPLLNFVFIGSGAVKDDMIDYVDSNKILNVSFQGGYKRSEQNLVLNSCDLSIIVLAKGMYGLGVPSKFYNIIAAGNPILYIGDKKSEIAMTILEYNIGFVFGHDEYDKLLIFFDNFNKDQILKLKDMSINARNLAEKKYSKKMILDLFGEIL